MTTSSHGAGAGSFSKHRPIALITGAARRVGLACARSFADAGCDLVLTYRSSRDEAEHALASLASRGTHVHFERLVMDDLGSVDVFAKSLPDRLPRLDVIVHNASSYERTPLETLTPDELLNAYKINAAAPVLLSRGAAPLLSTSTLAGGGAIVALGDIHAMGEHGLPRRRDYVAYAMSKTALVEMTRSLARELAPNVRVNMVAFGVVAWPESGVESDSAAQESYLRNVPLARSGTPEEAAASVRWLALHAQYVTGQVLRLDGGRSLV